MPNIYPIKVEGGSSLSMTVAWLEAIKQAKERYEAPDDDYRFATEHTRFEVELLTVAYSKSDGYVFHFRVTVM